MNYRSFLAGGLAVVAAATALFPGARSCAFPQQACSRDFCQGLRVLDYQALNDPNAFDASRNKANFSRVPRNLGFYYSKYNPSYNHGHFDASLKARSNNAPFVNWIPVDTINRGYRSDLDTLAKCCDGCRLNAYCTMFQFDASTNDVMDDEGNVISSTFTGTGDCYFVKRTNKPLVDEFCAHRENYRFDDSVNPTFFGGSCNPSVEDDPHFVGARGTRFDFNGQLDKSFCLVADERLHINTVLRGYEDPQAGEKGLRSWMKELGFVWADAAGTPHSLHLVARNGREQERGRGFIARVAVDGTTAAVPAGPGEALRQAGMSLTFMGVKKVGPYEVEEFHLKVGDVLDVTLALRVAHPKLQAPDDAEVHFNLVFNHLDTSPRVHGVLGQTYRPGAMQELKAIKFTELTQILGGPVQADGASGRGFLEGNVADYVNSSPVATDCKFSPFMKA